MAPDKQQYAADHNLHAYDAYSCSPLRCVCITTRVAAEEFFGVIRVGGNVVGKCNTVKTTRYHCGAWSRLLDYCCRRVGATTGLPIQGLYTDRPISGPGLQGVRRVAVGARTRASYSSRAPPAQHLGTHEHTHWHTHKHSTQHHSPENSNRARSTAAEDKSVAKETRAVPRYISTHTR